MKEKLGNNPSLPISQGAVQPVPMSLQSAMSISNVSVNEHPIASSRKFADEMQKTAPQSLSGYGDTSKRSSGGNAPSSRSFGTRTEKVLDSFLQNPVFKGVDTELQDEVCYIYIRKQYSFIDMMKNYNIPIKNTKTSVITKGSTSLDCCDLLMKCTSCSCLHMNSSCNGRIMMQV